MSEVKITIDTYIKSSTKEKIHNDFVTLIMGLCKAARIHAGTYFNSVAEQKAAQLVFVSDNGEKVYKMEFKDEMWQYIAYDLPKDPIPEEDVNP